jgi:hypothetical protein
MLDQIVKLERLGIRSTLVGECQKEKGIATKIMEGEFSIDSTANFCFSLNLKVYLSSKFAKAQSFSMFC